MKNIKAGSHFALTGMWRTFHSKTEVILIKRHVQELSFRIDTARCGPCSISAFPAALERISSGRTRLGDLSRLVWTMMHRSSSWPTSK
jgi:hypothetical protein